MRTPAAARLAALREFGHPGLTKDDMAGVWRNRLLETPALALQDLRIALRSLLRAKGLAATIVITLALGIGANAAIFSVVRDVLLRPLVNRDEATLVYLRQSAPGLDAGNATFSVPEIKDLRARVPSLTAIGEFSTVEFNLIGFGEPQVVKAGVVDGSFFDVMGLKPVLGRLLAKEDEGVDARRVVVLTNRFWTTRLGSDPAVVGREITLDGNTATVVGVLEPAVPYPSNTEIMANMVASPHHLDATMVTERTHRMTELFGRLAPGATLEDARAELKAAHAVMASEHPEAYAANANMAVTMTPLREQITRPARTILLVLLAAAGVVFLIACSNVANLILARSVRREGELAVRAALGASSGALRRTLLAESIILCGAGAVLGVLLARPFVYVVARYAARFSVRALDARVDSTVLWIGAGLAMTAAVALAYVPRLPALQTQAGLGPGTGAVRITPNTNRRLRVFAVAQIALCFVLLSAAGTLVASLVSLQSASTGFDTERVLALDVPAAITDYGPRSMRLHVEMIKQLRALPGVEAAAVGTFTPWRDAGSFAFSISRPFLIDGQTLADGEVAPHARFRIVSPGFFGVMGVPIVAGRDFTDKDRMGGEEVVMVNQSVANLYPNGNALNHHLKWKDPLFGTTARRIVGIVADVDDEHVVRAPALTVYHAYHQMGVAGRVFVRASGDPYALVPAVTKVIRDLSPQQPVEKAATLEDVKAEVLSPNRLNAFVMSGFAIVALLIAVVGVSGVLAFSASARVREFGVRLAVGSTPMALLLRVLSEGVLIVSIGITAGVIAGLAFAAVAHLYFGSVELPGAVSTLIAAGVLVTAGIVASLMPAARAARVDVLQALRSE